MRCWIRSCAADAPVKLTQRVIKPRESIVFVEETGQRRTVRESFVPVYIEFMVGPFFNTAEAPKRRGRPPDPTELRWRYAHMAYEVVRLEKINTPFAIQRVARAWGCGAKTVQTALDWKVGVKKKHTLRQEAEAEHDNYVNLLRNSGN
jgi:hypothetical protein